MKTLLTVVFAALLSIGLALPAVAAAPDPAKLKLASANVLVLDAKAGIPIYAKGADAVSPIASLTKLMTAIVVLESQRPLDEMIEVDINDLDFVKGTRSRLSLGTQLTRREMLQLALMSSENRAASALARYYPGGRDAFVARMNAKAREIGMTRSRFTDPTGLSPDNVSTAHDVARLVSAAAEYPLIREFSTTPSTYVELEGDGRILGFNNSNRLVATDRWEILLQKTGYIREAGRCLVMLANVSQRPVIIVLLDSIGRYTRLGDAERVKHWLETGDALPLPEVRKASARGAKSGTRVRGTMPIRTRSAPKLR
jgi:D-alanyl-D-alanine endopeptidase (penicillin-binding protein 7)